VTTTGEGGQQAHSAHQSMLSDFAALRARQAPLVDKTTAIADLLVSMRDQLEPERLWRRGGSPTRTLILRPPGMGKSTMLSAAAEMLAAGELPPGVRPWPGYVPVDIDALFGGLDVHTRYLRNDPTLGNLLREAYFVVKLDAALAVTGHDMSQVFYQQILEQALAAFGRPKDDDLRVQRWKGSASPLTPSSVVTALLDEVPPSVKVAVLVDNYDTPLVRDLQRGDWEACWIGLETVSSLLMASKDKSRISLSMVTGVVKFACDPLVWRADHYVDITSTADVCAAVDWTERELRTTFADELQRLAARLGTNVDGAVAKLADQVGGYCFDGATTCFHWSRTLAALRSGQQELAQLPVVATEVPCGPAWLGITPSAALYALMNGAHELQYGGIHLPTVCWSLTLAAVDCGAQTIADAVTLMRALLQTGVLTLVPRDDTAAGAGPPRDTKSLCKYRCRPPNEPARQSLQLIAENLLPKANRDIAAMAAALQVRSPATFGAAVQQMLADVPATATSIPSKDPALPHSVPVFSLALFGVAYCAALRVNATIVAASPWTYELMLCIVFRAAGQEQPEATWIVRVGGPTSEEAAQSAMLRKYEFQPHLTKACPVMFCGIGTLQYAEQPETVTGGAARSEADSDAHDAEVAVTASGKIVGVTFTWSRRVQSDVKAAWEAMDASVAFT
jgi:hypothetical protein